MLFRHSKVNNLTQRKIMYIKAFRLLTLYSLKNINVRLVSRSYNLRKVFNTKRKKVTLQNVFSNPINIIWYNVSLKWKVCQGTMLKRLKIVFMLLCGNNRFRTKVVNEQKLSINKATFFE